MKVFTIKNGKVEEGARVDSFTLKGAKISIPAILIGEEGRGRILGVLPVQLTHNSYKEWREKGYTHIYFAQVGKTKSGRPKLFQAEDDGNTEKCICVFRTMIGFRGSNSHTGDMKETYWYPNWFWRTDILTLKKELKERYTEQEAREIAKELNSSYPWDVIFDKKVKFYQFPGKILSEGIIAQGDAGRMGSGEQLVSVIPAGIVFRTAYSGRLYGHPEEHFYIYRDGQVMSATKEEREISSIF